MPCISVIVPVLNEEAILPAFLSYANNFPVSEIIIVDGGSQDQTQTILHAWACERETANRVQCHVMTANRFRGNQMNAGAAVATSDLLLFLHADSRIPSNGFDEITTAMQNQDVVGGTFRLQIDSPSFFLKWISIMANLRSSLFGLQYGDQGFFVRKELFQKIGGYSNWPLMEDVAFIKRLQQEGRIVLLKSRMITSARRWQKRKYFTSVRNLILLLLYLIGVSPKTLAAWYN